MKGKYLFLKQRFLSTLVQFLIVSLRHATVTKISLESQSSSYKIPFLHDCTTMKGITDYFGKEQVD